MRCNSFGCGTANRMQSSAQLTTERYRYDGPIAVATLFATAGRQVRLKNVPSKNHPLGAYSGRRNVKDRLRFPRIATPRAILRGSDRTLSHRYHLARPQNSAVATSRVTLKGQISGQPVAGQHRSTLVWVKGLNGWQLIANQLTPLAAK